MTTELNEETSSSLLDWNNLLALVIPVIMILVSVAHGFRVNRYDESPWIGAGFGMFADIDGPQRVFVVERGDAESLRIPANSSEELTEVANSPVRERLTALDGYLQEIGIEPDEVTLLQPVYERGGDLDWTEIVSHDYR